MVPKLLFIPRHETSWSKMKIIIETLKTKFNCEILISGNCFGKICTDYRRG